MRCFTPRDLRIDQINQQRFVTMSSFDQRAEAQLSIPIVATVGDLELAVWRERRRRRDGDAARRDDANEK
jgi:hypothetical protein